MGEVIDLHTANLKDDHEFIADLCRFAEGIVTKEQVKKKHRFDDAVWTRLGDDDELVRAIEAEKTRRIRDGSSKREKAQMLVVKAPDVVAAIMLDENANARHRIDASKALDGFAAQGPEGAPPSDRFIISINLGEGHIETFNKSIAIDVNDGTGMIAADRRAKKRENDDGGPV